MKKRNKAGLLLKEKQAIYGVDREMITIPIIEGIVEKVVNKKLQKLLSDPDYGLELRDEIKRKLDSILKRKGRTISEEKIAEKYGVKL
ncbi:MAG: hypothetical protein ABIJ15_08260 [bacterium]